MGYANVIHSFNFLKSKFLKADYNKLLELLYQVRMSQGLRQSDVASFMGVPQSFISKIESGERQIDIMTFIQLCESLSIDPIELFTKFIQKLNETKPAIHTTKP